MCTAPERFFVDLLMRLCCQKMKAKRKNSGISSHILLNFRRNFRRVCHSVKGKCRKTGKLRQILPMERHLVSDVLQMPGMDSLFIFVRFISSVEWT